VDGSSRFGSNNKYGMFPSLSVGWVLTEEDFFPKNNTVNFWSVGLSSSGKFAEFRIGVFNNNAVNGPNQGPILFL
jgi:hypothetical protein